MLIMCPHCDKEFDHKDRGKPLVTSGSASVLSSETISPTPTGIIVDPRLDDFKVNSDIRLRYQCPHCSNYFDRLPPMQPYESKMDV